MPRKDPEQRRAYRKEYMRLYRQSKQKMKLMAMADKAGVSVKTLHRWMAAVPFFKELINGCPEWHRIDEIYKKAGKENPFKSWVPRDDFPKWYTIGEVADKLSTPKKDVSVTTVRRWIREGKVTYVRHGEKGRIRIFSVEVDRLKKEQGVTEKGKV